MTQPSSLYLDAREIRWHMFEESLMGDAFALGTHWIYDLNRVESLLGTESGLQEPPPDTFHIGKHRGDQTHYGDQALMLFDFLQAGKGNYDGEAFRKFWLDRMKVYQGYQDTATRESIALLESGARYGYLSDELGGAVRIASVLYWVEDPQEAVSTAVDQARLTHGSAQSLLVTDLFARTAVRLLQGETHPIIEVIRSVRDEQSEQLQRGDQTDVLVQAGARIEFFDVALDHALKYLDRTPRETAVGLGQSCHAHHALPVILNILARNADYRESLRINSLIGGDSAARAMLIGLLLGARAQTNDIPALWRSVWKADGIRNQNHMI